MDLQTDLYQLEIQTSGYFQPRGDDMMEALTRTPAPTRSEDSRTTWEAEVVALGGLLGREESRPVPGVSAIS